ncbi:MAG: hypothetical protein ACREX9_12140, partial [Gammaproteobacteria bacterium]
GGAVAASDLVVLTVPLSRHAPRLKQIKPGLPAAEKIPGVRALDGGTHNNARILEQLTALLITLNIRYRAHGAGMRITGLPNKPRRAPLLEIRSSLPAAFPTHRSSRAGAPPASG